MSWFPLSESVPGAVQTAVEAVSSLVATIGQAIKTTALQIAGSDGTNARLFRLDGDGHTQADVLSSALPADAATQTTLAALNNKTPALGSAAMAASSPTTLATDDAHLGAVGAAADVDGVVHGQLRYSGEAIEAARALLSTIEGKVPAKGTALMAGSTPTTVATDDTMMGSIKTAVEAVTTGLSSVTSPDPGASQAITPVTGGVPPVSAEMVALDVDTKDVIVQGSVVANAGTACRIRIYGEGRDNGAILLLGDFPSMEVNGNFVVSIQPTPVGAGLSKIGAWTTFTDGGADPVFTVTFRQHKA